MKSLNTLGITASIPLTEMLGESFNPNIYGLSPDQREKISALKDVMTEYGRQRSMIQSSTPISTPLQAATAAQDMRYLEHEEIHLAYLNGSNKIISKEKISDGGTRACAMEQADILRKALSKGASAIILYHNHPSGSPTPSKSDITFTTNLKKACNAIELILLDHIVITQDSFYSFADEITQHFAK